MRQIFLLIFCISLTLLVQAQVSKTVNITAGGLSTALTATEKSTITNLTVTGTIDARDFKLMSFDMPLLSILDLSVANVVEPANEIPESAFEDCSNLTSIILPSSLTAIGKSAFYNCSSLKSIVIPNGVTSIQNSTFEKCINLKSILIPSSVTSIGEYAFEYCSSLESINLPESLVTIEDESFKNCTALTSITIPSKVKELGDEIFSGCDSLATVIISEGVTTIGRWMFDYCGGITSISLPNSLTTIKEGAFEDCIALSSLALPPSVSTINEIAFVGCKGLKTVTLPSSITTLGEQSFAGCSGLISVKFSEGISNIGVQAFYKCVNLTSVVIPSTVSAIGKNAFGNCEGLTEVILSEGVDTIGYLSFSGCINLTTITIPGSLVAIEDLAFSSCSNLKSILIPSTVSSIGDFAFSGCTGLNSIYAYPIIPVDIRPNWPTFEGVNKNTCILYVQKGSKSAYMAATQWKDFSNIVEMQDFSLSSATINLASTLNSKDSVNITTSTSWSASSNQIWLTISPPSGVGNGKLIFNATENSTSISRTAEVTLTPKDADPQTITVTQEKGTVVASLVISTNLVSIDKDANSIAAVDVISNVTWSASSDQTWLTANPLSGTGNGKLTFTVEKNPTNVTRSAIVTVSSKDADSQNITITQEAGIAILLVSSNTVSLAKEFGSIATVNVTSNSTWNATADQTWLTVNPASGAGNGTLTFTATSNTSATNRSAIITVSLSESTSQIITITQEAGSGTWVYAIPDNKIKLYPNPTSDKLYIEGIVGNTMLVLSDLNGRIWLSKEVVGNEFLSVGSLPQGIYILRITSDKGFKETKLVKK